MAGLKLARLDDGRVVDLYVHVDAHLRRRQLGRQLASESHGTVVRWVEAIESVCQLSCFYPHLPQIAGNARSELRVEAFHEDFAQFYHRSAICAEDLGFQSVADERLG